MSICREGLLTNLKTMSVKTLINDSDPLIRLGNAIDWQDMTEITLPDLKKTRLGFWWLGRKLYVRIHLAVMILQVLLKKTDRGIEKSVCQTPVYQVFCGFGIISKWHCPDHTKIEEFRNRLTPETHKAIGDHVLKLALELGFADPTWMDLDSTVQEANTAYPSDASLMLKLAKKCSKVWEYLVTSRKGGTKTLAFDLGAIQKISKEYFFLAKNASLEKRRNLFQRYHKLVKTELGAMIKYCEGLGSNSLKNMPWNISSASQQIAEHGWRLLLDIAHFVRRQSIKKTKILSFHCGELACIKKGKVGKDNEFGRVFQLGRIGGNFLKAFTCRNIRMNDKKSFIPVLEEYASLFGQGRLKSLATDKGYYTNRNIKFCIQTGISVEGIQRPGNIKTKLAYSEQVQILKNRRAGIEPLIGHVKEFGLGKSKMRSDQRTLSSGYRCVTGFNLHQVMRHMEKKVA